MDSTITHNIALTPALCVLQRPLSKLLAMRSKSIESRASTNGEEEDEDSHLYSDIDSTQAVPKPRKRRQSGNSADSGLSVFVNGSYGRRMRKCHDGLNFDPGKMNKILYRS